jgi:methylenetetrahydrofolate reductase (NADPH)
LWRVSLQPFCFRVWYFAFTMSTLSEKFASGEKVFTAEITPPKGAGIKKLLAHAQLLGPHVDAINITDCQRSLVRMSSMAACKILLEHGYEPVFQLTCRDRNTIALQSDLMGASAMGIRNVLCLTGDPVKCGDSTTSKSVFEVEALGLLDTLRALQGGRDRAGHKMNAATKFFVGAVVNPSLQNLKSQLIRMEKKVKAGATFFQTQANYDLDDFRAFLSESKQLGAKVLAGVLILHTEEMANYVHENIPGISIPQDVLAKFKGQENAEEIGIDFAVETMLKLEEVCDGFHMMSIRAEALIPKVLEKYNEQRKSRQNVSAHAPSPAWS